MRNISPFAVRVVDSKYTCGERMKNNSAVQNYAGFNKRASKEILKLSEHSFWELFRLIDHNFQKSFCFHKDHWFRNLAQLILNSQTRLVLYYILSTFVVALVSSELDSLRANYCIITLNQKETWACKG